MSPRAWRWNSDTPSSCSSAETCRDTADCESPSCSPAWVKLPASAAAWKTLSLSQSILDPLLVLHPPLWGRVWVGGGACGTLRASRATPQSLPTRGGELHSLGRRARLRMRRQEMAGFERRHAALAGGGHRLAVDIV